VIGTFKFVSADAVFDTNAALELTFPFIQAIGVCLFKSSYDPLSNVSALYYLRIISINQIPTKSYWDSMISEVTVELEKNRKLLVASFLEKESSLPISRRTSYNSSMREDYLMRSFSFSSRRMSDIIGNSIKLNDSKENMLEFNL
jgi:hypothetical protein